MSTEKIDYTIILADAEAKIAALQDFVASLRKAAALGALSQLGEVLPLSPQATNEPVDLPVGALSELSVPAAIKMYLGAVKKKQTAPQIVAALKEGGMESRASNFYTVVAGALFRLKKSGEILRFKDGWGLAALYPEHIRKAASEAKSPPKRASKLKGKAKRGRPPKATIKAPSVVVPISKGKGLEQKIETLLKSYIDKPFSTQEVAKLLGETNPKIISMTLGRMHTKHTAEKCGDGKYRAPTKAQKVG